MSEAFAAKIVTDELWQSLFTREKADVAIECNDEVEVWCNRTALAAASRYFHCLLSGDWLEGKSSVIKLESVDSHLMQAYLLEYFKTGESLVRKFAIGQESKHCFSVDFRDQPCKM